MIVFFTGVFSNTGRGQGGPPLLTDDPGTPGDRKWEINTAFILGHRPGDAQLQTPLLDFNYGLGERLQLKYEVPIVLSSKQGRPTRAGVGDSRIGLKWRFVDTGERGLNISTYPQLTFENPTWFVNHELDEAGAEFLFPLEFQKNLGVVAANLEVGYAFRRQDDNEWIIGVALGREISERLELLGEVHMMNDVNSEERELILNMGARWKPEEHYTALLAVGRGLGAGSTDEPDLIVYFAIQFHF